MEPRRPIFASFDALRHRDSRDKVFAYILGLVGWVIVLANAPYGWAVPSYANF